MKFVVGGGGTGVEAATTGLAFGKCVVDAFHAAKPPTNTKIPTAKPKGARFDGTTCGGLMASYFLVILYSIHRHAHQNPVQIEGS
jgi:hypothetical protein